MHVANQNYPINDIELKILHKPDNNSSMNMSKRKNENRMQSEISIGTSNISEPSTLIYHI